MKKLSLVVLVCVLLTGAISLMTLAADFPAPADHYAVIFDELRPPAPGGRKGYFGPGTEDRGFAQLKLTAEQQKKIVEIRQNFQKETLPLRLELEKKELELRLLWDEIPLNQKAIEAAEKEKVALKIQFITKSRAMFEQLKSVLTPEQQKQIQTGTPYSKPEPGFPGQDRPF